MKKILFEPEITFATDLTYDEGCKILEKASEEVNNAYLPQMSSQSNGLWSIKGLVKSFIKNTEQFYLEID